MDISDLDPSHPDFDRDVKFDPALLRPKIGMDIAYNLREQGRFFNPSISSLGSPVQKALQGINSSQAILPEERFKGLGGVAVGDVTSRFRDLTNRKTQRDQAKGIGLERFHNPPLGSPFGDIGNMRLFKDAGTKSVIGGIDTSALGRATGLRGIGAFQIIGDALRESQRIQFQHSIGSISEMAANTEIGKLSTTSIPTSQGWMSGMLGQGLASLRDQSVRDSFEDAEVLDEFIEQVEDMESQADKIESYIPEKLHVERFESLSRQQLRAILNYCGNLVVGLSVIYAVSQTSSPTNLSSDDVGWIIMTVSGIIHLAQEALKQKESDDQN